MKLFHRYLMHLIEREVAVNVQSGLIFARISVMLSLEVLLLRHLRVFRGTTTYTFVAALVVYCTVLLVYMVWNQLREAVNIVKALTATTKQTR